MHFLSKVIFIVFSLGIGQCDPQGQEDNEFDQYIIQNMKRITNTDVTMQLIRITGTKQKGGKEVTGYHEGVTNAELYDALKSFFYSPLPPLRVLMSEASNLYDSSWYSSGHPSILILHDQCGRADSVNIENILRAFWMRAINENYNIFIWNNPGYFCDSIDTLLSSIFKYETNYPLALKQITQFLQTGMDKNAIKPDQMNLIGIGISANLAADVAMKLDVQVESIIGLDPPLTQPFPDITTYHAYHLQILYTTKDAPNVVVPKQGSGRVDFFFTYERITAGDPCGGKSSGKCIHELCVSLFIGAILVSNRFEAWKCDSLRSFQTEQEHCNVDTTVITYPPLDTPEGRYFLRVKTNFPYGIGAHGRMYDFDTVLYNEDDEEGLFVVFDPKLFSHLTPEQLKEYDYLFHRREEKRLEPGDPNYYLQFRKDSSVTKRYGQEVGLKTTHFPEENDPSNFLTSPVPTIVGK